MDLDKTPGMQLDASSASPAEGRVKGKYNFFEFLELLKYAIVKNEKEVINKAIDDIPADKMELIIDYDPDAVINSFSDYIEWILDFSYSFDGEDEFYWLNLLLADGNEKLLEDIAAENKIPLQYLYTAVIKRLLNDLGNNFDVYEKFYHLKFA
jgi:hypothetical protein